MISLVLLVSLLQAAVPPVALPGELRSHVQGERFEIITSIRGLPLGVRNMLETLFGNGTLDIAEPRAEFQVNNKTSDSKLPGRRLVAAGCSYDHHCLVYYERGGTAHTWRVALFHWRPDATRLEWAGTAPSGLVTIDDVQRAILSGAIKGSAGPW